MRKYLRLKALLPWVPVPSHPQSKSHHSRPDLSISPTTPHCRSSLIPTNPLQLWKQRNIIFHCIFFLRHQKRKTFLCFHRERYISLINFTRQVKASNPSPARAHLTLLCKTREEHFSLSLFFLVLKSHSVIKRNCSIPLIGSEDKFFPQPGGHGHQQLFISCID